MRTVIYARYSAGPKQTDQSIEGQVRVCTEFCKQRGLPVQEVYADRHISGKTDERPEFRRLIEDAKRKKFDILVVYKTDRFARNKYDSAIYKRELRRAGVQLLYAAEAIPEGPEGIILESLMEGLAEYYSAELSQKVKRGIRESAIKGRRIGSTVPFGLCATEDNRYAPDPVTAPAVRKAFNMYIEGKTATEIGRVLNAEGYRSRRGRLINHNMITRLLKNPKYMGEYRNAGVTIPDFIEPVVSKETFYLAQKEMKKRQTGKAKRAGTADYLLAGKLFCGLCGSMMHGVSGTSKTGKVHYYYACGNRRKRRGCTKESANRDWIESEVVRLTREYLLQENRLHEIAEKMYELQAESDTTKEDLKQYNKRLRENKTASDNLLKVLEKGMATDTILARLKDLEDEREAILGEIAFLETRNFGLTAEQLEFFLLQYIQEEDEDPAEYRKRIIESFVSKVVLWDDRLEIHYTIMQSGAAASQEFRLQGSPSGTSSPLNASQDELKKVGIFVHTGGIVLRAPVEPRKTK